MPPEGFAQAIAISRQNEPAPGSGRPSGDRRMLAGECPPGMQERRKTVRRRANRMQGRGLETLGHAVEYLVDSRMFVFDPKAAKAERDAVQILMRSSRAVFAECKEVVTLRDRVQRAWNWFAARRPEAARQDDGLPQL